MANRHPRLLNAGRTVFLIGLSVVGISVQAQVGRTPATPAATDGEPTLRADLAFDVVSIRPSNAENQALQMSSGDQYAAIGMPIGRTILMAYFPFRMGSRNRIVGAPGWVWNDKYDFIGKVGEVDLSRWQKLSQRGFMVKNPMLQVMLQSALADRCKLAVHRIPTQIDGYALVIANHGPNRKNLVKSTPDEAIPDHAVRIDLDGRVVPILSPDNPVLHFFQTSMAAFALFMSGPLPVVDRTGLQGIFKFDITRLGTEGIQTSDLDLASLGLKLVPIKIPTENVVIDHIERPSPN